MPDQQQFFLQNSKYNITAQKIQYSKYSMSKQSPPNFPQPSKYSYKPHSSRLEHRALYDWSRAQLARFQKIIQNTQESQISVQQFENQRKVVISMLVQLARMAKQQFLEKGLILEQLLNHAIQFMNQHQKHYDMLSYTQIKHFRDSISDMEKEYGHKNAQLMAQIDALTKDKEHRWRNIFMVVKDNRVLRRQKGKLMAKIKEEIWRTRQLEEDLISVRSQNQKYKIMCQEYKLKENQLKNYVTNQLLLLHLDEKVRKYPGRARRLLKQQLVNCQINELNTLEQKIKFILQAMQQNNEVCQDFDDWNDNIESTRLFYNVSVQTYVEMESVGINTITPVVPVKTYQSTKAQVRLRDFMLLEDISKTVDLKIAPTHKKNHQVERKKTQDLSISMSRFKRRGSITNSNPNNNSNQAIATDREKLNQFSGFKQKLKQKLKLASNTVIYRFVGPRTAKVSKNFTSMVLNISSKTDIGESEKMDGQGDSSQKISAGKIKGSNRRKQRAKIVRKGVIYENEINFDRLQQDGKKIPHYHHQVYQLYYKPLQQSHLNITEYNEDNILSMDEPVFHLQEKFDHRTTKIGKQPFSASKHKSLLQPDGLISKILQNNNKKYRTLNCELFKQNLENQNTFPILEVQETTSNRTIQSTTNGIMENFQYVIGGSDENGNKQAKMINRRVKNQPSSIITNQQMPFKSTEKHKRLKTTQFQPIKRHKRQHTQNIQQIKSKFKVKQFLQNRKQPKIQEINKKKLETAQLKRRDSKVLLSFKDQSSKLKQLQQLCQNSLPISPQLHKIEHKVRVVPEKFVVKSQKLIQKLFSSILSRRKQLIANPQNLRIFLHSFLLALFQNKPCSHIVSKIRPQPQFYSAIKSIDNKQPQKVYLCLLLESLFPSSRCQLYTEDMLILFVKMIQKLNMLGVLPSFSNIFTVPYQYGIKTLEYLCSIFLSPGQTLDFRLDNIGKSEQNRTLNMVQCFLKLSLHLEKIIFESQLWQFVEPISRWSVEHISEEEIRELFALLALMDAESQQHFKRLRFYASKSFPLHRLCLYAHRFEWKRLYKIKQYIQDKYLQYFGFYILTRPQVNALCQQIQQKLQKIDQFPLIVKLLKEQYFKSIHFGLEINQSYLKLCRLTSLMSQIEKMDVFPGKLEIISRAYRGCFKAMGEKSEQQA